MLSKLFVVGLPRDMEEIKLVELFSAHGIVNTVTIVTDKLSGKSKGYGFLTMADQTGAERAIAALDGSTLDGRQLSVRIAEDKQNAIKNEITHKAVVPHGNNKKVEVPVKLKRPRRPKTTDPQDFNS
jgi:RNA recognition motif-containing protein